MNRSIESRGFAYDRREKKDQCLDIVLKKDGNILTLSKLISFTMGQKHRHLYHIGLFMTACTVLLTIPSCIDELYDLKDGISSEMVLGGDSLALPLGSSDTIRLSDFLSTDDIEMLKTMENGGYGLTMKDSISVNVPKIDQSSLKIDDQLFTQKKSVSFGEISMENFEIPAISKTDTVDLGLGNFSLANFVIPHIGKNEAYSTKMSDYELQSLIIRDTTVYGGTDNMLSDLALPGDPGGSVEVPLPNPASPSNISTSNSLNYLISVPSGISNIDKIDLSDNPDAVFEVSIELVGADDILTAGTITPDLTINPSDLFDFEIDQPNGIKFGTSDALTKANNYKVSKTLDINAFNIEEDPTGGKLNLSKNITFIGTMTSSGMKVMSNNLVKVHGMDLKVSVSIRNVAIESMDFDIPTIQTQIAGITNIDLENEIPSDIGKVNTVFFEDPGNLTFALKMQNLPTMINRTITIDQLSITFPEEFVFEPNQEGLSGRTYTVPNSKKNFDPILGLTIALRLDEMNMSNIALDSKNKLVWGDDITYSGLFSFKGRINSKNIPTSELDTKMALNVSSALNFNSAEVITRNITKPLPSVNIPISVNVKIAEQVDSLNVVKIASGTKIRVTLVKPDNLPHNLTFTGDNIRIVFPPLFTFNPPLPLLNTYVIPDGPVPDYFELELDALNINQKLVAGKLDLSENISVAGNIILKSGVVNSLDIENLNSGKMYMTAETPALKIASTTVKLKSLNAEIADTTNLNISLDQIPAEIVSLDSILLENNATLQLSVNITNMPSLSTPLMANLTLNFPDLLQFTSGSVNASNQLVINEPFVNGKLSRTIGIKGLHFDGSKLNQVLSINEDIAFNGRVSVNNPSVNSSDLNSDPIEVNVDVRLTGIQFKSVYGKVDPGIDPVTTHVKLPDLPDFMKGEDVVLDITRPVIALETRSNLGIPIIAGLNLTPMKNNAEIVSGKQNLELEFPRSSSAAMDKISRFWIAPDSAGMPGNYKFIKTDIQNIFKTIPDEISFIVNAQADTEQEHYIDLTADYRIKVKYDVTVPMAFGKDLSIEICDTISDLDETIGEVALSGKRLELFGTILNSIPLDLRLTITPLDSDHKAINIPAATQLVNSGARDGSATSTALSVKLDDPDGLLKDVRGFELRFRASSNETVAGTPIKPENFVKADLKVRLNGGLKIGDK